VPIHRRPWGSPWPRRKYVFAIPPLRVGERPRLRSHQLLEYGGCTKSPNRRPSDRRGHDDDADSRSMPHHTRSAVSSRHPQRMRLGSRRSSRASPKKLTCEAAARRPGRAPPVIQNTVHQTSHVSTNTTLHELTQTRSPLMTIRQNILRLVAIAALAAVTMIASLDHARSATLYDTFGTSAGLANPGFRNNMGFGLSFQTTANEYTLTKVTFAVARDSGATLDGNLVVRLWDSTGSGSLPGAQIGGDLGTFPLSGLSEYVPVGGGYQPIVVDGLNIGLSPSTNYWATVTLTGNTATGSANQYYIQYTTAPSGTTTGSLGATQDTDDTGTDAWQGPFSTAFQIGSVEAVPEPATLSMVAGAGLVVLLTYRRRHSTCGRVS